MALSRFGFSSALDEMFDPLTTFSPRGLTLFGPRNVVPPTSQRDVLCHPGYEVHQDDKHYMVSVDVPGVRSEDMTIQVEDKMLRLTGARKMTSAKGGVSESKFDYRMSMGDDVNLEKITAHLDSGVLHLTAPKKSAEKPKSRTIQISTGPVSKQIDVENKVK